MPQGDTRSLRQIKQETERTRAELTETVAQLRSTVAETSRDLRERIKPAAIKAEVRSYVRSRGEQLFDDLTDAARKNPIQAAAVCGSLAYPLFRLVRTIPVPVWMVGVGLYLARSEPGRAATRKASAAATDLINQAAQGASALRDKVSDAAAGLGNTASDLGEAASAGGNAAASGAEQLRDAATSARASLQQTSEETRNQISQMAAAAVEKAVGLSEGVMAAGQSAANTVKSSARDANQSARQAASSARQAALDLGDRANRTFAETVEQNPLLVAGLGLLIGGVIAGALPRSDLEDELIGQASRSAKRRAKSTVSGAVREGVRRAARQAEAEGLDPEGVSETVHDVGERVRRVTEAAVTTAFEPPQENEQQTPTTTNQTPRE